ncbi:hypothetical protein P3T37_001486 [Kitasatospora sp. MAA4]|uniref:PP2C family protein-serine/threonine phosphatase n=1 Tax=Kitasatospora sp. MAA4 TaxID=3035093 RepID=UPI002476A0DD|nr:GAF domain-containing SpoIIE family protein phosphatase [Kitasatospora sp. MAA4]MDH6132101.1 hypothetical protein [Kitasatospora sp. MAA4]
MRFDEAGALSELLADRARLALLDEAAERVGTALDLVGTCAELAQFAVANFADLASVEILPPEAVPAGLTYNVGLLRTRRLALDAVPALRRHRERLAPADQWVRHRQGCPTSRSLESGRVLSGDRSQGSQAGTVAQWDCEAGANLADRAQGAPSWLVVPLQARGQLIGALTLLRTRAEGFPDDETSLIAAVADRAARSIDSARRFALAQDLTVDLQRALLADPGSPHANLDLASRYLPCGTSAMVGGDWFETIRLSFGRTLLVIGDVMGHGVEAAVDMSSYRTMLRYIAATDLPPHAILRQLDHLTSEGDATRPATCLLALIEPARGRCTLASAGHLPPTLITPDEPARLLDVPTGPPLGTGLGAYTSVVHALHPGQVLLLYTDGLVERRTEDIDTSLARLTRLGHQNPSASLDELLDQVLAAVKPATPEDDIAVLAARIHG